jgi:16S rRNA (cytidine1402-2'-O)-methyltransferase
MLVMGLLESFSDFVERFWFHAVSFHRQGTAATREPAHALQLSCSQRREHKPDRLVITRFHRPGWIPDIARDPLGAFAMIVSVSGTLYVVATPIGNLDDITLRAIRILKEVDRIACEDTRHTRKLLDHLGIAKPLVSYHEHNEQARADELLGELAAGRNIALVSDAGTPLIADPGYRLVAQARAQGIVVTPIPGSSAVLTALSASGLPTDAFFFGGFLPAKKGQRRKVLEEMRDYPGTTVFYEAPHRILESLEDIAEVLGLRRVTLARELTKIHEEFLMGNAAELRDVLSKRPSIKGEITLMIGKDEALAVDDSPIEAAFDKLIAAGVERMDAMKTIARERGLSKREVYQKLNAR